MSGRLTGLLEKCFLATCRQVACISIWFSVPCRCRTVHFSRIPVEGRRPRRAARVSTAALVGTRPGARLIASVTINPIMGDRHLQIEETVGPIRVRPTCPLSKAVRCRRQKTVRYHLRHQRGVKADPAPKILGPYGRPATGSDGHDFEGKITYRKGID